MEDLDEVKASGNMKFYTFISILEMYSHADSNGNKDKMLSNSEINEHMKRLIGEELDRKTIPTYIEEMKRLKFDIVTDKCGGKNVYGISSPKLDAYEVKILVDMIAANKFLTTKRTKDLIDKILGLTNVFIRGSLEHQLFIEERHKGVNEEIFYNIDKIHQAIMEKKKISFIYCDYNEEKKLVPRTNKHGIDKEYKINPIYMVLNDGHYYLILNLDYYNNLSNYRIDRMKKVEVLDEERKDLSEIDGCEDYDGKFNPIVYTNRNFKMFNSKECHVEMEINKNILNSVIDYLGDDVVITPQGDDKYIAKFTANEGYGLIKWILQLGSNAVVIAPEVVRESVKSKIEEMMQKYI